MTQAEYEAAKKKKYQEYKAGLITNYAYIQWKKKNNPALNPETSSADHPITYGEYVELSKALFKKENAGLITDVEYRELHKKLETAYNAGQPVSAIEKEIGCDPGTLATDESVIKLGKELKKVYGAASKEIQAELDKFMKDFGPEIQELEKKAADGTITPEECDHLKLMTLQKAIMGQKADQLAGVMTNANQKALKQINGEQLNVFAENANWQSFQISKDTKLNLMFSVYDESTAAKLIQEKPELLPRKEVNGKKDKAWNRKIIASTVLQGVIQGDSIPKLAKRIAMQTGETNMKDMIRYARTAMTSAQNAGRMEMLHRAQGMGIQCKKVWLATLDSRTRDSHRHLDGKAIGIDEKFPNKLMYPGDPSGPPAEVYNCRCTLIYEYEDFPNDPTLDRRIQYDEYTTEETDADGKKHKVKHRESSLIQDMTYDEWHAAKTATKLNDLNAAKYNLAEAQKAVIKAGVKEDKVYEGLWKDPVTLADYPAKKAGIPAKLDYYETEIEKYKQAQANGASWATDDKIQELEKKKKLLKEYEKRGELVEKRDEALKEVQDIYDQVGFGQTASAPTVAKNGKNTGKKADTGMSLGATGGKSTPFGPEAYSQERKDSALWAKTPKEADRELRGVSGEVWRKASAEEKAAIYDYTGSYHKFNEPLRGIQYGTSAKLGVGKTDLDAGYTHNGRQLNAMTDLIARSTYDKDIWLQRGCRMAGMDDFFNVPMDLLLNGSQEELQKALLGTTPIEYAFMSCGSNKGSGLNVDNPGGVLLNIYAPRGTQMMYVEPFSRYGGQSKGLHWDGKTGQTNFGQEVETLINQGTQFRVLKVTRKGRTGKIYVDLEIINQDHKQRWHP